MKNKILKLTLACTVLLTSVALGQECRDSWYISASGTFDIRNDSDITINNQRGEEDFKVGFGPTVALGKQLGQFRTEAEYAYKPISTPNLIIDTIIHTFSGSPVTVTSDDIHLFMLNGYYDIPVSKNLDIYLGAGAGLALTEFNVTENEPSGTEQYSKNLPRFGAQGMIGLSYCLSKHWDIFTGYRHIWIAKGSKHFGNGNKATFDHLHMNTLEAGLRFKF